MAGVPPSGAPPVSVDLFEKSDYRHNFTGASDSRRFSFYSYSRVFMANTPQAKKRIRRNDRRAEVNGARIGRIRTFVKKVESALDAGDKSAATAALAAAQPEMARGVAKGVLHKNTVARKFARLTKRVAAIG
jgi:small subunit ribosomal protein S20